MEPKPPVSRFLYRGEYRRIKSESQQTFSGMSRFFDFSFSPRETPRTDLAAATATSISFANWPHGPLRSARAALS